MGTWHFALHVRTSAFLPDRLSGVGNCATWPAQGQVLRRLTTCLPAERQTHDPTPYQASASEECLRL